MYSKAKGIQDTKSQTIIVPPGYVGNRFRAQSYEAVADNNSSENDSQSLNNAESKDKAEKTTTIYRRQSFPKKAQSAPMSGAKPAEKKSMSPISEPLAFLKKIGREELLLIGLLIILAGGNGKTESDVILMIALLLCVG